MGYIKDLREKLAEKLKKPLDEKTRKEVADFFAQSVLESYRNGQKSTRASNKEKREKGAK
jgi:hypothetical protein